MITIHGKSYKQTNDLFFKQPIPKYENLKVIENLNTYERIIGFVGDCKKIIKDYFKNNSNPNQNSNQITFFLDFENEYLQEMFGFGVDSKQTTEQESADFVLSISTLLVPTTTLPSSKNLIFITRTQNITSTGNTISTVYHKKYKFSDELDVFVHNSIQKQFIKEFFFFFKSEFDMTDYNNLIHVLFMVKNAGDGFEEILTRNLPFIDRWTILDTGSSDSTISIIEKVLKNKKKGNLYQEPFTNFRDSRNRLLELARLDQSHCTYFVMLDDTYILQGNLRKFLSTIRGDQFANSFNMMIKEDDGSAYFSNRILNSHYPNLKYIYKVHEVITDKDNIAVLVPPEDAFIYDKSSSYMRKRTQDRKLLDLKILLEDADDTRNMYYIARTYIALEDYEKAAEFFFKRIEHENKGYIHERYDACFELARTFEFQLKKPWEECEYFYKKASTICPERPEPFYFIGIHYLNDSNSTLAFKYLKMAFELGFDVEKFQYCAKPDIYFYYIPKFLVRLCYEFKDYQLGINVCQRYFSKERIKVEDTESIDSYMFSWQEIFKKLLKSINTPKKEEIVFIADGGYGPWDGNSIYESGVGGSESFIIYTARELAKTSSNSVTVFCPCKERIIVDNVLYCNIEESFFSTKMRIDKCLVSRFSEYLPAVLEMENIQKVYFILHDLGPSGNIIPIHPRLEKIYCLTNFHKNFFKSNFPDVSCNVDIIPYGMEDYNFKTDKKIPFSFIYSSFANRGLLELVRDYWPLIKKQIPEARLDIYTDLYHPWVLKNYPGMSETITSIIHNNNDFKVHGWVDKKTLYKAWETADIWFYPCTFAETFCLTALEAAKSKTLAITNNLAALQDTVGDRGILIDDIDFLKGDFRKLVDTRRTELTEKNFNWAKKFTWSNTANLLF